MPNYANDERDAEHRTELVNELLTATGTSGLSELLSVSSNAATGKPDLEYHTGYVVAWNSITGENTIRVLGSIVQDVPVLSTSDSVLMDVDQVVGMLRFKSTYFILGRVTPAGQSNVFNMSYHQVNDTGSTTSTTFTDLATFGPFVDVNVSTSSRALVHMSAEVSNPGLELAYVGLQVIGAKNYGPNIEMQLLSNNPVGESMTIPCSTFRLFTSNEISPGPARFVMKYACLNGTSVSYSFRKLLVYPL